MLTGQEYFSGHTDWHDFNVDEAKSRDAARDAPVTDRYPSDAGQIVGVEMRQPVSVEEPEDLN